MPVRMSKDGDKNLVHIASACPQKIISQILCRRVEIGDRFISHFQKPGKIILPTVQTHWNGEREGFCVFSSNMRFVLHQEIYNCGVRSCIFCEFWLRACHESLAHFTIQESLPYAKVLTNFIN